jgi:hypothetical protein
MYILLKSLGLAGHAEIVTTVDQSAMRGLVPHEMMRQGLPHSTDERSLGSRRRAQGWVEDSPLPYTPHDQLTPGPRCRDSSRLS